MQSRRGAAHFQLRVILHCGESLLFPLGEDEKYARKQFTDFCLQLRQPFSMVKCGMDVEIRANDVSAVLFE